MISRRLADRLQAAGLRGVDADSSAADLETRRWLAIVSSHLGRSTAVHARVCQFLTRSMLESRRSGQAVLVASGSAIEPWVMRAAELFSVPTIRLHVGIGDQEPGDQAVGAQASVCLHDRRLQRDAAVIALADRVDCVYCRPRGTIHQALQSRLARRVDPSVRIAIHPAAMSKPIHRAALSLMDAGGVGWLLHCGNDSQDDSRDPSADDDRSWTIARDRWLVHCTRAATGAWPNQSVTQHRDELLLRSSTAAAECGTALGTLRRIVRMRRLLADSRASRREHPVVCFSARPLAELLRQRTYRPHLHRWDYEPYGIAIRKSAAEQLGILPVIYGDKEDCDALAEQERFRFQARGQTYDWTSEREWRSPGDVDLDRLSPGDARVFVAAHEDAAQIRSPFPVTVVGGLLDRPEGDHSFPTR